MSTTIISAPEKVRGKVKWFNDEKGYGFIIVAKSPDVFIHHSEIKGQGKGRRSLDENDEVEFELDSSDPRGPRASNLYVIS